MRVVVVAIALAAGLTACPPPSSTTLPTGEQPAGWDAQLKIPAAVDEDDAADVVRITLEARIAPLELVEGKTTDVWTYNGQLPGPTIEANVGDRVVVTFTNSLPEPTTVHWHGLRISAAMDGTDAAQTPVAPGETFVYDFVVPDAGTFWYHPHVNSGAQLGYGLYGAFVVRDPTEEALPLGDELVLVLSDMSLDDAGQLKPGDDLGWFGDYFGRQGSLALVNGRLAPELRARIGVAQRWRVINAARSKYSSFFVDGGHRLDQIGTDGGLLEHAVDDAVITLPPGARAEARFLPTTSGGPAIHLIDHDVDRFHLGTPPIDTPLFDIVVTEDPPAAPPDALPDPLRALPALDTTGAVEQAVILEDVLAPDGNTYLGINGQLYPDADHFHAQAGTTEVWTITNESQQDHPFHLHGFFFEVLDVDGAAPASRALFDTMNIEPHKPVRIGIPFDDRPGAWMFHCHILDHADRGMMRMLIVECRPPGPPQTAPSSARSSPTSCCTCARSRPRR